MIQERRYKASGPLAGGTRLCGPGVVRVLWVLQVLLVGLLVETRGYDRPPKPDHPLQDCMEWEESPRGWHIVYNDDCTKLPVKVTWGSEIKETIKYGGYTPEIVPWNDCLTGMAHVRRHRWYRYKLKEKFITYEWQKNHPCAVCPPPSKESAGWHIIGDPELDHEIDEFVKCCEDYYV